MQGCGECLLNPVYNTEILETKKWINNFRINTENERVYIVL